MEYVVGTKVKTHSLRAAEHKYNGLAGTVIGAVTVNRSGARRVLVRLLLPEGKMKSMLLHLRNLTMNTDADGGSTESQFNNCVAKDRDSASIKQCINAEVDSNPPDQRGFFPMYAASQNGHTAGVRYCGATPAHMAAQNGDEATIRALAELGADLNMPMYCGATPACMAACKGHEETIRVLAELGADINKPMNDGATPAHMAVCKGHEATIRVLAELGADLNTPDVHGATPAHKAAQNGHASVIRTLYKLGAEMKPTSGTPSIAELAQRGNHTDALQVIEEVLCALDKRAACQYCGSVSKRRKVCTGCEKAWYCSVRCQKQDRKEHKPHCLLR